MEASTATTTTLAVRPVLFSPEEEHALVGFLAGYSGLTREAYALDLRQYLTWCTEHDLPLFGARRSDIETFGRHLEALGRAGATIARRLCTITAFYRYAEEEGLIATSPAVHVRRPRVDYESHATGLDRNEVGALLVAAGLASARDHALISLLARNGLRVSEAAGADIEALELERGHRALTIRRKGGKVVTVPLAPRTARAIDLAVGERCQGPIFVGAQGERLDRHAAGRIVRRIARRAGITKRVGPHTLRHAFITPRSTPAFPCATSKKPPATPIPHHHALRPSPSLTRPSRHLHRRTFLAGAARQGVYHRPLGLAETLPLTGQCVRLSTAGGEALLSGGGCVIVSPMLV
jgi:integrase/recombinase XerD